jgi:poly(3-hydroxybutyrate) depolymerase
MNINIGYAPRGAEARTLTHATTDAPSKSGPLVIALHCSGSTGQQWQKLTQASAQRSG